MKQNNLIKNIEKLHTTEKGIERIKKNLNIYPNDVVSYLKEKILYCNCKMYKTGKNWYVLVDNIKITINSYSFTIITAHINKGV